MPIHENSWVSGDPSDLANDRPKKGLAGAVGGILQDGASSTALDREAGTDNGIAQAATPNATDAVAANSIDVVVAVPSGATRVDILVRDANDDYVSRTTDADGTVTINVGSTGAKTVYARGVDAAGRYGPWSAGDPVTVS